MARQGDPVPDDLRKNEEWLRLAEQGSPMGLWYWNEDTGLVFWDDKACEMFGVAPGGEKTLETFYGCLHPDDRARVEQVWRYQLQNRLPYDLEYRSVWPDGTERWIHALGSGYYDPTGKPTRMVGVVFDITERRAVDQERIALSGRLIEAQEHERRRLARELHDDFSQRLALLTSEVEQIGDAISPADADATARIHRVTSALDTIARDLHSLSHRLHSSTLEIIGLVPSSASLCREFSRQQGLTVHFSHEAVPEMIPPDAALCLFRILQEGLRNTVRHSGASTVTVVLRGSAETITLSISDNGSGFRVDGPDRSKGIGIQSMRERIRMLGGTFELRSRLAHGTEITASVPALGVAGAV